MDLIHQFLKKSILIIIDMMKFRKTKNKKGFSLIEVLLYLSILSMLILVITYFWGMILVAQVKSNTVAEVNQQGLFIMDTIIQTIHNADDINSPGAGTAAGTLSLDVYDAGDDPTVFDELSGIIRITEGINSPVDLHNSKIVASGLIFTNLSRTKSEGVIQIEFTLTYSNPEGRNEYDYEKTFYGSASLR
jgi:prepilin-type N-terminal cleavage/methylation domain-containing protein